jgi:GntR family transcriptional regulator
VPARANGVAPKHLQIQRWLRERARGLPIGTPMPSDAELCAEFGVSRMTARHAVGALVNDGLLHRARGVGTFVAQPPVHRRMGSLLSFSEEMRRRGFVPSSLVLTTGLVSLDAEQRAALRTSSRRGVLVRRVRQADGEPVAIEQVVLPEQARFVLDSDLALASLHELLAKGGLVPASAIGTLTAQLATAEDARLLRLRRPTSVLVERRTVLDPSGRPMELTETRYSGERYVFDVALDGSQ